MSPRYPLVDAMRGVAICGVVTYHLVWDLWYFDFIQGDWVFGQAMAFVSRAGGSLFLFVVGVSLVLAHPAQVRWRAFLRRIGMLAAGAVTISAVTWHLFPDEFVYFGILHGIAAASLMGVFFLKASPALTLMVAVVLVAAPFMVQFSPIDPFTWAWTGLAMNAPSSYDFWPVLPWGAATLAGMACTRIVLDRYCGWASWTNPGGRLITALSWSGRHTLAIYLLHQPPLFAIIALIARLSGR
ncbi:heparan-alpha-glucosaminide N-acetyltransferase [Fulvimarina manganoxydans]|nr:heparan-alpha-glucosaminide N-acetyltransferase [Fulvimarina manganoxydans]